MGEYLHTAGKTSQAGSATAGGLQAPVAPTEGLDAGVLLLSPDMQLEFASPAAFEILGCEDSRELAARLRELLPPLEPSALRRAPAESAAFSEFETPPRGTQARLLWRLQPAVSSARQWHVVLVRRTGPAAARERVLTMAARFASRARVDPAMLHDLRTPMNALALELELLKQSLPADHSADDELPERVRSIEKSFARFKVAWEGFARHCASRDENAATFAITDLLQEVSAPLEALARRRRVALEIRAPEQAALVAGRRDLLAQALLLIAIHRLDALQPGAKLTLGTQVGRERLQILLDDDGPNVPTADVSCFWEPRLAGGDDVSALSSYVARSIVLAHCGSLEVEVTAAGTRSRIELPAASAKASKGA